MANVGTTWQTYTHTFTMTNTSNTNAHLNFGIGQNNIDIAFDDITLQKTDCNSCAALEGTSCNDNDACTTGDVYDDNCNCAGTYTDADGDGYCVGNDPNDNNPCNPIACTQPCNSIQNSDFSAGKQFQLDILSQ